MEDFDPATLAAQPLVIVLSANTGEGDPPDNAVRFHKHIRMLAKKKGTKPFASMKFTVSESS